MNLKQISEFLSLLVLASLVLFFGCHKDPAHQAPKITIVTPYMANVTTRYVIEKFRESAKAKGWESIVTDTAGDFDLLNTRIEERIKAKTDAIVLAMGDPVRMTKGLEAARQANIPVFGLDSAIAPGVLLNIASDNSDLGTQSAEALANAIGYKGDLIMFTHDPHPGVRERAAAAEAVFDNYPDIKIIEKIHIEVPGPMDSARSITKNLLKAHPEKDAITGIWAGWDEPALGAYQVIQSANREVIKVIGIDGTDFAKIEIAKGGAFIGSVAQDFDEMAIKLVELIDKYFQDQKPDEKWYKIPGKLITVDSVVQSQGS